MQTLIEQAYAALQAQQLELFLKLCKDAFNDARATEDDLAWFAGNIAQQHIANGYEYIYQFMERFPQSLHPISVLFASLLLEGALHEQNQFDDASHYSRLYLRRVKDAGQLQSTNPAIQEGIAKAWLQLSAVYTEAGARSYSQRVLQLAKQFSTDEYWIQLYDRELAALQSELGQPQLNQVNENWENFFSNYLGLQALHDLCMQRGFTVLAKRLSALESQLRFGTISAPLPFEQEVWLVLFQDSTNPDTVGLK